jgi:hypothetical protein
MRRLSVFEEDEQKKGESIAPFPTMAVIVAKSINGLYQMDEDSIYYSGQWKKSKVIYDFLAALNRTPFHNSSQLSKLNALYTLLYILAALLCAAIIFYIFLFSFADIIILVAVIYSEKRLFNKIQMRKHLALAKDYIKYTHRLIENNKSLFANQSIIVTEGENLKWLEFKIDSVSLANVPIYKRKIGN